MKHKAITEKIIGCFYTVYGTLGYGFLEKIYENALAIELQKANLTVSCQPPIEVLYDNQIVGQYFADIVVNDLIIVEIKAVRTILPEHEAQLLNYLNATQYEVGLLLNFGRKPQVRRKIFDNDQKRYQDSSKFQT